MPCTWLSHKGSGHALHQAFLLLIIMPVEASHEASGHPNRLTAAVRPDYSQDNAPPV
ncbi:hypothetical protein PSP6_240052 [Paraburkholderia tropica]|nr:hypothetical protein PSP6_240052 [Paraburkholderia tropica]